MTRTRRRRAVLMVAGVSLTAAATATSAAGSNAPDPLSADSLMANVTAYAAIGADHLTGTPREAATQDWVAKALALPGMTTGSVCRPGHPCWRSPA